MVSVEQTRRSGPAVRARTLEELYEIHAPGLRRRCLRLTSDPHAAEDLMQEVFVRFMARFPEVPADMNVGGYLYATARNILWKQLRDGHEVVDADIERSAGPDDDLEVDPERAALLEEQQSLVRRCFAVLTGRQRRALTLREVEGHSYAEIGSDLGIGSDAVAQVIARARVRLRAAVRRAQVDLDQLAPECRAMIGPLSDHLDGRAQETSPEIESHLAECESCRHTLSAFQGAGSRLRGTVPLAPLAGIVARIGEAFRLGGGGPIDAIRAGALAVAAAVAIGGGGMYAAGELTGPAPAAAARAVVAVPVQDSGRAAPTADASPALTTARRTTAAPVAAPGRRETHATTSHVAPHPRTPVHPKRTSDATPTAATPVAAVDPAATPPGTPPSVTPGAGKPAGKLPVTVGGAPVVDKVVTQAADKVVAPVVTTVVAPVVKKVVDPVVDKVVVPAVSKVVAPVVAPVTNAIAPVAKAVAPVVAPVTTAVAPVTAPVQNVVNAALPPAATTAPAATAPATSTPAASTPAVSTPAVSTPVVTVPSIKIGLG
jgi:RNA polymerase sigma factor (sigma-70 family)